MTTTKLLKNQQKKRTQLNLRVSLDDKTYIEMLAKKKGLTVTGLVLISLNRYSKGNLEPDLESLRKKFESKINVDIEKERLKLNNFYRYLPSNTVNVLKNICSISLRLKQELNMKNVNHLIDGALKTFSYYPDENKGVIIEEMKFIESLKGEETLWSFLCSRYPKEFQKSMRNVETQKSKFHRRK